MSEEAAQQDCEGGGGGGCKKKRKENKSRQWKVRTYRKHRGFQKSARVKSVLLLLFFPSSPVWNLSSACFSPHTSQDSSHANEQEPVEEKNAYEGYSTLRRVGCRTCASVWTGLVGFVLVQVISKNRYQWKHVKCWHEYNSNAVWLFSLFTVTVHQLLARWRQPSLTYFRLYELKSWKIKEITSKTKHTLLGTMCFFSGLLGGLYDWQQWPQVIVLGLSKRSHDRFLG